MKSDVHSINTDLSQFKAPLKICDSLSIFKQKFRPSTCAYSIQYEKVALDVEFYMRDQRVLVVFFNGAIDRQKIVTLPAFNGRSISSNVKASCLFISDSSLYIDPLLTIGWYAGNKFDPSQTTIAKLLEHIMTVINPARVMFFGGSAGGFASLFFSRTIAQSVSVVWNPQTILENYYRRSVEHYARSAFDLDCTQLNTKIVTNLADEYRRIDSLNTVVYLQNITDRKHVDDHLTPFLSAQNIDSPRELFSGWLTPRLHLHLTDWSKGHTVPPRASLRHILTSLSDPDSLVTSALISRVITDADNLVPQASRE